MSMALDSRGEFLYPVAEVAGELVILDKDSPEQIAAKRAGGFVVEPHSNSLAESLATYSESLRSYWQGVIKREGRRRKHGQSPEQVTRRIAHEQLLWGEQSAFKRLLQLAATEHDILQEMGIGDRTVRGALFKGAEQIIGETKFLGAQQALGLEVFFFGLDTSDIKTSAECIRPLERLQQRLLMKHSPSPTNYV